MPIRTLVLVLLLIAGVWPVQAQHASYDHPFRPQFHFTPAENWMNDPNGMVYHDGEYHLFYQYNPFGDTWGHMSWGHAVSTDLVHWEHLPVALPEEDGVMIFSGSAVVDTYNTTGFGTPGNPPLVAIYTGAHEQTGIQDQRIAYSLDRGRTWTKYEGNPVLDEGSTEFRDPKVFWYEREGKWVMVIARSAARKIAFYSSVDLKTWTHLSDFGPAGATGGVWECPDLFELPVENGAGSKWVLQVDLGSGAVAGGSGAQYFVGTFDGTHFHAEDVGSAYAPEGTLFADFEGDDYGAWSATGAAFGDGPAGGTLPNQQQVAGFEGSGLVNTYYGGDASTGTLTSPRFTIERSYVNFLIGGGNHPEAARIVLLVDGEVVRTATGQNTEILDWHAWDVSDLVGREARLQIVDRHREGWGHILIDHIIFSEEPARSSQEGARWVDYGKDYYAAVSWSNVPNDRRLWLGWISNWQYASVLPTSGWRGAQSVPREVGLRAYPDGIFFVQEPVRELELLRGERAGVRDLMLSGTRSLAGFGIAGTELDLVAEFEVGQADTVGLVVRAGDGERTVVGYDVAAGHLFVDRTESGETDFHPAFAGVHGGPLPLEDGRLRLRVLVDRSVVEVFGSEGRTVITDRVFPKLSSDGVSAFARGGTARLVRLDAYPLRSIWADGPTATEKKSR